MRKFVQHWGVVTDSLPPMTIFYNNQIALADTKDLKYHSEAKYIDIKYNSIRDIVQQIEVGLKYISTHQMVVDTLTKPIPCDVYFSHI